MDPVCRRSCLQRGHCLDVEKSTLKYFCPCQWRCKVEFEVQPTGEQMRHHQRVYTVQYDEIDLRFV